jgi:hypothetical protein
MLDHYKSLWAVPRPRRARRSRYLVRTRPADQQGVSAASLRRRQRNEALRFAAKVSSFD